jgi:hypothetical protein
MRSPPELSKTTILEDPLVRILMDADGVSLTQMITLMEEVSARLQPTSRAAPVRQADLIKHRQ